jgi:hypothetical protein
MVVRPRKEQYMNDEQAPSRQPDIIPVEMSSGIVMIGAIAGGFLFGLMIVALDPWIRFDDVPLAINWREALLNACLIGGYGSILSWTITAFWRSQMLWIAALFIAPILAAIVALWNSVTTPFGVKSDLVIFIPAMLILHVVIVAFIVLYMNIALWFSGRRLLGYAAIPLILLALMGFAGVLRWNHQDAKDVVFAVDQYAHGVTTGDYTIEYLGIRYGSDTAPTGDAKIHTDEETYLCRVRIFPDGTDVSCSVDED